MKTSRAREYMETPCIIAFDSSRIRPVLSANERPIVPLEKKKKKKTADRKISRGETGSGPVHTRARQEA